ncbi:hypothetical protein MJO28_003373 [Puccinia striiformis f. sp. tritici]|uniref:Uncharacterized protein n=1 Tax=Puccinia striiformis f. sp. tritici TaxID=168172 RepID=A0ACC0ESZ0_9BASI|nr:hypothetical protein Pst134EB_005775 [Puccinia striiformis f. sp. tritici]KAI7933145.1 hypothetical protein MJO29_017003 [Puccinia striiformis f. sp. tritici]KAI7959582.1 hypothetical protein MJO28_003373 [Puccinia striiformis f. sp. tritici]KAI7965332.1 hypothetical protein MJO29_003430 [Puccinia striiformis f. sp. tritici]KAI9623074.1 hypothetical protein KEM48_009693 [Puccinia striiformis f. sp. tritici PST-130]
MKPSPSNPEEEEQRLSEINARAFPSSLATSSTINGNSATHQDLIDRRRQRNNDITRPIENLGNGASELQLNQEREKPKIPSKLVDPCQAARKASLKCLDRNNYDKSLCYDYFEVYRECQKRWIDSRKK